MVQLQMSQDLLFALHFLLSWSALTNTVLLICEGHVCISMLLLLLVWQGFRKPPVKTKVLWNWALYKFIQRNSPLHAKELQPKYIKALKRQSRTV